MVVREEGTTPPNPLFLEVLEQKLKLLEEEFGNKQAQLTQVLNQGGLDPAVVREVTSKLESVLAVKNNLISDLEYQVHLATKTYNDTVSVYESKLTGMGIPVTDVSFEKIPSITSTMPAGKVAKTM